MELVALERSFQRHLRAENLSARSVQTHSQGPRRFRSWLASEGLSTGLESLTRVNIREWLAGLSEEALSASYIRILWAGMKRFTDWLVLEEEIAKSPMTGLKPPSLPEVPVPIVSEQTLSALVKACKGTRPMLDRRDEAIIRCLLDTGMRAAEIIGMRVEDLNLDTDSAIITGKGSKKRVVWFSARTARAIDRYLRLRDSSKYRDSESLWIGLRGPITYHALRELLKYRAKLAGVDYARPHRFRHTMAHDWLSNGGQERDLMRLAGWSSPAMLAKYGASQADERAKTAAKRLARGDRV